MERAGGEVNMEASTTEITQEITVTLISPALTDLEKTSERQHLSWADIVNRAISLYAFIEGERAAGTELVLCRSDGSTLALDLR
jgi:hypothetical protein